MDKGVRYDANEKDRKIAVEGAKARVGVRLIAAKLGIATETLEKAYGDDMRAARYDRHLELTQRMNQLSLQTDDKGITYKATDSLIKAVSAPDLETGVADGQALGALKAAVDSLVELKEQQHDC